MSLDFKHQISFKDEIMNDEENNDDDSDETFVIFMKRKKIILHHSDICVINEDKSFYHLICFDFQFQKSNSKQFSEKTITKEKISCLTVADFNFENLNSDHIKIIL